MTAIDTYRDRLIFEQSVRDGQTFRKKIRAWPTVLDRKRENAGRHGATSRKKKEEEKKNEEKVPECSDCQGPYNKAVSR